MQIQKGSKTVGVQKAGSAPKAQAQSGQQQKTQSTQKKPMQQGKRGASWARRIWAVRSKSNGHKLTGPNSDPVRRFIKRNTRQTHQRRQISFKWDLTAPFKKENQRTEKTNQIQRLRFKLSEEDGPRLGRLLRRASPSPATTPVAGVFKTPPNHAIFTQFCSYFYKDSKSTNGF